MTAYGIPYTITTDAGVLHVATVQLDHHVQLGYTAVVAKGGPVMLVPTAALTPVDTTPEEPEPGAWLIGETMVFCIQVDVAVRRWTWHDGAYMHACDWPLCWTELGGPGITPRRLIPEPAPVELPVRVRVGGHTMYPGPEDAEGMAAALLSAARIAREAAA